MLEDRNQALRSEIAKLEEEREQLRHMLATHDILPTQCNMKLSVSEDDDFSTTTSIHDTKDMEDVGDIMDGIEDSEDDADANDILDQVL